MKKKHADKHIFWLCLIVAIGLFIGGFFCPPIGVIDGSVLTAGGILLGFAALGIAGQNIANGETVTFKKGDVEVEIGDETESK